MKNYRCLLVPSKRDKINVRTQHPQLNLLPSLYPTLLFPSSLPLFSNNNEINIIQEKSENKLHIQLT